MSKDVIKNQSVVNNEEGATMVEYGLMLALIAVVCIVAIIGLGEETQKTFNKIGTEVKAANKKGGA